MNFQQIQTVVFTTAILSLISSSAVQVTLPVGINSASVPGTVGSCPSDQERGSALETLRYIVQNQLHSNVLPVITSCERSVGASYQVTYSEQGN